MSYYAACLWPKAYSGPVESLLEGLKPHILPRLADPEGKGTFRVLFSTPLPESAVAPYLTELAAKVEGKGVKVGSYPRFGRSRNTVTLVGRYESLDLASVRPLTESQGSSVSRELGEGGGREC